MSDQDRPGPPDGDPLIGGAAPPPLPPASGSPAPPPEEPGDGVIGVPPAAAPPPRPVDPWESRLLHRDPYDMRYSGDGPRAGYYGATRRSAPRTAAIYLSTIAALVIGGVLIFLLFQVLNDSGGEAAPAPTAAPITARTRIESPVGGQRLTLNEEGAVIVSVLSGEEVVRFDLLISGIPADQQFTVRSTGENTYAGVLTARFQAAGVYELVVRAYTVSGEPIVSEPVQIVAVPAVSGTPDVVVTGAIVAVTSLRTGPGEDYNQAGTLEPGDVVTLMGRTGDLQWLQIERGGGLWVRRSAVEISIVDLERVEIREEIVPPPTRPTPPPTTEGGETPTPTPTATPPPGNAPDFIPTNAALIEGGAVLRITITNVSTNPFSGDIVVRIEEGSANPAERSLNASMEPNGDAFANFDIDPPIIEQTTVRVIVDPDDAIAESSEDNNATDFIVVPEMEGPVLSLVPAVTGGVLSVTIQNDGSALSTRDARLIVNVPGERLERVVSPLAIPENESVVIEGISAPRTGKLITITLFIDGVNVATASVPNPNVVDEPDGEAEPPGPAEPDEPDEPQEPE